MQVQRTYAPVFEDWLFHVLLPFAAYATMGVSAFVARTNAGAALFVTAATALLLLFIGIHNAWDAVTYHVFSRQHGHGNRRPTLVAQAFSLCPRDRAVATADGLFRHPRMSEWFFAD
jgi:hypothetical protein